ncbi:MAG: hypothetical protein GC155_08150 [Alphaproteobacteria bacterium]|nr:hypothetical protein [Alphaproteobacteria bacterium]
MKRILLLIVAAIAAGGAYLSRPDEATLKMHMDAYFADTAKAQAKSLNIGDLIEGALDSAGRSNAFKDYYVVTRLTATADGKTVATCWGVYSRVLCTGPLSKTLKPEKGS